MKKTLLITILILLLLPLSITAAERSARGPVVVQMTGFIDPSHLQIIATDESGRELNSDDSSIRFDFPAEESWNVQQEVIFSYTSNMMNEQTGRIIFDLDFLSFSGASSLKISHELVPANISHVRVENDRTFAINFQAGMREKEPIGSLIIRIRKNREDVFSAGIYHGFLTLNFIEGG